MKTYTGKRPLWRVEYVHHVGAGACRMVAAAWCPTLKSAQAFIGKALLTMRVVRDMSPEKHRDWPRDLTAAERRYLKRKVRGER